MSPEWRPYTRIKHELAYRLRRALEAIGGTLFVGTSGSVAITAIHQLWSPVGTAYAKDNEIGFGDPIATATLSGVTIATSGL